jgi:hypothetical protein
MRKANARDSLLSTDDGVDFPADVPFSLAFRMLRSPQIGARERLFVRIFALEAATHDPANAFDRGCALALRLCHAVPLTVLLLCGLDCTAICSIAEMNCVSSSRKH